MASSIVRLAVGLASGLVLFVLAQGSTSAASADPAPAGMRLVLPLGRSAYQDNEWIDLTIVRWSREPIAAGDLLLTLTGADGSRAELVFPLAGADVEQNQARRSDHLHINGRLLRPGAYGIVAKAGPLDASTRFDLYSHVRRSEFKTIDWGSSAQGREQAVLGPDSMGFNLLLVTRLSPDDVIRGGCDFMQNCTMGGAHQMDLHQENDWSDPRVLQGGEARVVRQALRDRTQPGCLGVHFYDEPGLTWWEHPRTGVSVPFNIPAQDRSYKSAFDADAPQYDQVRPDDPASASRWEAMNRWKLSFMDAAWHDAAFGVSRVAPGMISAVQSEYAFEAYADGYYFNITRHLPVISGHGGYDDGPATYFYPSFHHEFGRMREPGKPEWYMPTWYGIGTDNYRLEQNLSFMTGLEGIAKPPDYKMQTPAATRGADGIVEVNKLYARLGPIFTRLPIERSPVAQLYSLSQDLGAEMRDMQNPARINQAAYEGGQHNRAKSLETYLAGKAMHIPLFPIVEEDVLDGSLAAHHKAVVLPGIDYLDPKVVKALEASIRGGGVVLVSDDSKVNIAGAERIGASVDVAQYQLINELWAKDQKESMRQRSAARFMRSAEPLAKALKARLEAIGIRPDLDANSDMLVTSRAGAGEIDYLFAVNATGDGSGPLQIESADAQLSLPADDRPLYDAVHGGAERAFEARGDRRFARLRFGPGQMRVWARTARPIGGVSVHAPAVRVEYTDANEPARVMASAALLDRDGRILAGVAPLRVRLIDPLGQVRYDLYRACERGLLDIDLPLALNDPPGQWTLRVRELLDDHEGSAAFEFHPPSQAGAIAGVTRRAVSFAGSFEPDREHVFRFFRQFRDVTIVAGPKPWESAAAQRIVKILAPWDVKCRVESATDAASPRELTPDERAAWSGLEGSLGPRAEGKPGPVTVGFNVRGPAILLGSPDDNALIKFALDQHFLPYAPDPSDFPGRGRGFVSWQRDAVSYGSDSVTLIAYDPAGMSEAVGTMYECAAGLDPLTRYDLPADAAITPASKATEPPEAKIAWRAIVPDRVTRLTKRGDVVEAASADGSIARLASAGGKIIAIEVVAPAVEAPTLVAPADAERIKGRLPDHIVKRVAKAGDLTAVGYWGGVIQFINRDGSTKSELRLPNDVCDLLWDHDRLIVGVADATVVAIEP